MENRLESARLKQYIAQGTLVKVYLQNGYLLIGTIKDFDGLVIEIETNGAEKMVYKRFISTIEPCKD